MIIDNTVVAFVYGFLVLAALVAAVAVAALVIVVRDARRTTSTHPVLVTVAGPSERGFSRAA